ncbi:uncharacterized protein [Procambarus clarkii]|uniref:uncharacterized protein n=1 Tax=Procambarus clarkii TaxID=6728 RepID=UPI001E672E7A|nr:uncharacterized protein LOC123761657 [Procambarus clarkii]
MEEHSANMLFVGVLSALLGCMLMFLAMRLAACLRRYRLVIEQPPEQPEPSQLPVPSRTRLVQAPMLPPRREAPSQPTVSDHSILITQLNFSIQQRNYLHEQPTVHRNLHSNQATRTIHSEPLSTNVPSPTMDHYRLYSTESFKSADQPGDYHWSQDCDVFPSPLSSSNSNSDYENFPFIREDKTNLRSPRRMGSYVEPEEIAALHLALFKAEIEQRRKDEIRKDKDRQADAISRMKQEELKKQRRKRF